MGIDRARIAQVAMHGYTRPADATGLSDAYARYRDPAAVAAGHWVQHDPAAAARLLDLAGWRVRPGDETGRRFDAQGRALSLELELPAGFSDWIAAGQIAVRGLRRLGVDVRLRAIEYQAWFERLQRGDFELSMAWSDLSSTPHGLYRAMMSNATVRPLGEAAAENWHRFGLPEADQLLQQLEATVDREEEWRLTSALQHLFVQHAPGHPAVPRPAVGRVQRRPLPGFPRRTQSVRAAVPLRRRSPAAAGVDPGGAPVMGTMRYLLRRLGFYLLAAWASLTLAFVLPRLIPGDPASTLFARFQGKLRPEAISALRGVFGLDDGSLLQQYGRYLGHILRGELGMSISHFPASVGSVIGGAFGWSLLLGGVAVLISFALGTLLGVLAAWRRGGWLDSVLPPALTLLGALPYFWLAMLALFLFGFKLGWFPVRHAFADGLAPGFNLPFIHSVLSHAILPGLTIVLATLGGWLLAMRNTMLGELGEDYLLARPGQGTGAAPG